MPADDIDPLVVARAAMETLVFAPIGLGAKLVDDAPGAVRRIRQELSNARLIGRMTVEQGAARMRDRTSEARVGETVGPAGDVEVAGLAIDGYDEMPAIEIVGLLDDLTPSERDAIAAHEQQHRQRRTVLGKIAQLAE